MYLLYNSLLYLFTILFSPVLVVLVIINRRLRDGLAQKFGIISWQDIASPGALRPIWVHAVSVGEVTAALPLLTELKRAFPGQPVLLSTATATGKAVAERSAQLIDRIIFFPFDYPPCARLFLSRIQPRAFIALETELWPNFLRELTRRGVPSMLVSGRISSRSFPRYRMFRFFFRRVLANLCLCSMQSPADAERIIELGEAPEGEPGAAGRPVPRAEPEAGADGIYRRQHPRGGRRTGAFRVPGAEKKIPGARAHHCPAPSRPVRRRCNPAAESRDPLQQENISCGRRCRVR
jgi:3-deoxy-D-manno-octulosonic-acid transferase